LKNWDPFHFDHKVALLPDLNPITGNYSMNFIYLP
jgi:hypothetical protein